MKKAFISFLSVFTALIIFSVSLGAELIYKKDKAAFEPLTEYGDREVLKGLTYKDRFYSLGDSMITDFISRPYEGTASEVHFNKFPLHEEEPVKAFPERAVKVSISDPLYVFVCGKMSDSPLLTDMKNARKEVSEGIKSSVSLKLRDYYEYYPLDITFFEEERQTAVYSYYGSADSNIYKGFSEMLKIPVNDGAEIYTAMENGELICGKKNFSALRTYSVSVENTVYFTFPDNFGEKDADTFYHWGEDRFLSSDGTEKPVDLSCMTGGGGIYSCSFDDKGMPDPQSIKNVYPAPENVSDTEIRGGGENIFFIGSCEGRRFISPFDTESFSEGERYYFADENEVYKLYTFFFDGYLLLIKKDEAGGEDRAVLYDGAMKEIFSCDIKDPGKFNDSYVNSHSLFCTDGKKAALITHTEDNGGYILTVIDSSGLIYAGEYALSSDKNGISAVYAENFAEFYFEK